MLNFPDSNYLELFRLGSYLIEVHRANDWRSKSIRVWMLTYNTQPLDNTDISNTASHLVIWRFKENNGGDFSQDPRAEFHKELNTAIQLWLSNDLGLTLQDYLRIMNYGE